MSDLFRERELARMRRRLGQTEVQESEVDADSGTWTPAFAGTTIAGTFTYSANTLGVWRRLGDLIYIEGRVQISAIGPGGGAVPTGNMVITGLPYACSATAPAASVTFGQIAQFNYTNTAFQLIGRILNGESRITLTESFDNVASVEVPAANFTNAACNLIFSAWYRTDS